MHPAHKKNLIIKVLILGGIIAVLSYLFHPSVGQFNMTINGEPVSDPLFRFAAIPTFLAVMAIVGFLSIVLFFGLGLLVFLFTLALAFVVCILVAPYLWPVLVIIFLVVALSSVNQNNHSA